MRGEHFDKALTPFWKKFLKLKDLFDAKLLIKRLLYFNVQKTKTKTNKQTSKQTKKDCPHWRMQDFMLLGCYGGLNDEII